MSARESLVSTAPGTVPSRFARRFVSESSLIESLPMPEADLARPWSEQPVGHLLAYRDAVESALGSEPLREAEIKAWQGATVREQVRYGGDELDDRDIGEYRHGRVFIGGREGVSAVLIGLRMRELLEEIAHFRPGQADLEGEVLAFSASMHRRYEIIHPFADGNGRSGRLLALWICVRFGVRPVLFTAADRVKTYYPCFDARDGTARMIAYFRAHQVSVEDLDALL